MAVRVVKKQKQTKSKSKPKLEVVESTAAIVDAELVSQIDKLGKINDELAPAKQTVAKLTKVYKPIFSELQDHVDEHHVATEEASLKSEKYVLAFGPHGNQSTLINPHKAFELLEGVKEGLAWELMGFGITELRKYLTPTQFEEVTDTDATKARSLKITKL